MVNQPPLDMYIDINVKQYGLIVLDQLQDLLDFMMGLNMCENP